MKEMLKLLLGGALAYAPTPLQTAVKEKVELMFWRKHLRSANGPAFNGHYEKVFTEIFEFPKAHFDGKRMLDIGCGPLGSLEWAENCRERVGADPLADEYLKLNRGTQKMRYVKAAAENLPFDSDYFDVVSMFNALDHVENAAEAVAEAVRVLKPGGDLLVIVEINHKPTLTEPHTLTRDFLYEVRDCSVEVIATYAINDRHDVYESIFDRTPPTGLDEPAIVCAKLVKDTAVQDRHTSSETPAVSPQKAGTALASEGSDTTS